MVDIVGYFPATLAIDSVTGARLRNATAQVFAMTDTSFATPLAITDMAGVPLTGNILSSNSDGIYPEFKTPAGVAQVIVKSGSALTPMTSIAAQASAAVAAATAATSAAGAASTAAGSASTAAANAAAAAAAAEAAEAAAWLSNGTVVVYVDDVATVARPATSRPVLWVQRGSAYPVNMAAGDLWAPKTSSVPVEPVFASLYAAWDPATLVGLGDAAAVASWADTKAGLALAQSTAGLRPTLTVPSSGKPFVTFANKAMAATFAAALTQPTTLFAVVRNTSLTTANTSSTHRTLFDSKTASKVRLQQSGSSTATALYRTTVGSTTRSNTAKLATTDKQILALVLNGTAIGPTGSDLYVNGAGSLSSALVTTESFDGLTVGCNYLQATDSTLGAFAQTEIYDIRLYSGALSTAQLTALTNFMATKHGVTL